MRPRLGRDAALELPLDAVVADRGRCVETIGDVRSGQFGEVAGVDGVARPDAGVAICLELGAYGAPLSPCLAGAGAEGAEQVLDMVAVFVREHIGLREGTALSAELRPQIVEEAEIDVDVPVVGAVEGANIAVAGPQPVSIWSVKNRVLAIEYVLPFCAKVDRQ